MLMRDETTKELHMALSSTIVLKRKNELLCDPLNFENGLTIDALVESRAYVGGIAQNAVDIIEQQSCSNIFKIDDLLDFQTQLLRGYLDKPLATVTLKFDNRDNIFAKHFVV